MNRKQRLASSIRKPARKRVSKHMSGVQYYSKPISSELQYVQKSRKCLRCRSEFRSEGSHNRVCKNCKKTLEYREIAQATDNSQGFCP